MILEYLLNLTRFDGDAEIHNHATIDVVGYSIIRGDLEPDLVFPCKRNGVAVDLTGALAHTMRWLKPNGTVLTGVALVASDLAAGELKRVWVAGDTDLAGVHRAQVVVTAENGETMTFPSDSTHFTWVVNKQLGDE